MKQNNLKKLIRKEIFKTLKEIDFKFNDDISNITNKDMYFLFIVPNDNKGIEKIKKVIENLNDIFYFKIIGKSNNKKEKIGKKYKPDEEDDVLIEHAKYLSVYIKNHD